MYRAAVRSASRPTIQSLRSTAARTAPRRFASTASPADKPRSWKSSVARWGLAVAGVYYYNVNSALADEFSTSLSPGAADGELPTVESMVEQRRKESSTRKQSEKPVETIKEKKKHYEEEPSKPKTETETETETPKEPETQEQSAVIPAVSPAALDEEPGSQDGAFNPETGEINWDCPCLGGMAHGPCGEQFKTAFSCFVYSTEEPKGMDCIEKFQGMQECFRQYPEIYGSELQDDEADADAVAAAAPESDLSAPAAMVAPEPVQSLQPVVEPEKVTEPPVAEFQTLREDLSGEKSGRPESENRAADQKAESATPWTDTTAANEGMKDEKK